jgi:hypothetical protein
MATSLPGSDHSIHKRVDEFSKPSLPPRPQTPSPSREASLDSDVASASNTPSDATAIPSESNCVPAEQVRIVSRYTHGELSGLRFAYGVLIVTTVLTCRLKLLVDPAVIDLDTFTQILELDEGDETHDFSRGMTYAYFAQAADTLKEMDEALYVDVFDCVWCEG